MVGAFSVIASSIIDYCERNVSANLSCYPNYIFSTLDHRKTGVINFEVSCREGNIRSLSLYGRYIVIAGFCHRPVNPPEGVQRGQTEMGVPFV